MSVSDDIGATARTNALERLGLDDGADEKAIRKAYARELKLIDPETDIPGFQALREAYETAIGLRTRPAISPASARHGLEAQEAYDWIVAAVEVISGGRRIADETIWVDDLIEQLTGQQPIGIDAGWQLESAIGRLLTDGWKPGHEALLVAATMYFGWAEEGTWPSQQLADAWFERFILHRWSETLRAPLVRVIRDLRQVHEPDLGRLRRDHGYFEYLAKQFPNLAPIIVDWRMLERWRDLAKPLGRAPDVSWRPPSSEENESFTATLIRTLLILLTIVVWMTMSSRSPG